MRDVVLIGRLEVRSLPVAVVLNGNTKKSILQRFYTTWKVVLSRFAIFQFNLILTKNMQQKDH